METNINKIGLFTSGGDSPGMNAAIRAVVRTASFHNIEVAGIYRGYQGMIDGEIKSLVNSDVSNIIQRGGTILKSARCSEFMTTEGRKKAAENLKVNNIDAFVAIGGDGTFSGAKIFHEEFQIPFVGLPGTIDNDLFGTDFTIGYDTAINTVVEAIDKIRDTAASHDRLFFIEVMGKDAGFIALHTGIGGGAEAILVPESDTDFNEMIHVLQMARAKGKTSSIVVVAEGDERGGALKIAEQAEKELDGYDTRVVILGHLQRGGAPSAMDRVLASSLGHASVEALLAGKSNIMIGKLHREISEIPIEKAVKHNQKWNERLYEMSKILSS